MQYLDLTKRDLIQHKVKIYFNVLRPWMMHRVGGHVRSTHIVTKYNCGTWRRMTQFC
jgi:hypothetical protein